MTVTESLAVLWRGFEGTYGTIGSYAAIQRAFLYIGLLALPGGAIIDAPFGRFQLETSSNWSRLVHAKLSGNPGWFLMEIWAPLSLIRALLTPLTTHAASGNLPFWATLSSKWSTLPLARILLAVAFLVHYSNRAVLDPLVRNPSRAPMAWYVVLLGALFNLANGTLLGRWIAASPTVHEPVRISSARVSGLVGRTSELGVQSGYEALFWAGLTVWAIGFVGNMYHDEILYNIKRDKLRDRKQEQETPQTKTSDQPKNSPSSSSSSSPPSSNLSKHRYAIPHGGLFKLVSHPNYTTEWLEWTGFLLASLCLVPGSWPSLTSSWPALLRPMTQWYVQPPALFLWNEIAAMLPRAIRGHQWYARTFGDEWPKERRIVVPWLF